MLSKGCASNSNTEQCLSKLGLTQRTKLTKTFYLIPFSVAPISFPCLVIRLLGNTFYRRNNVKKSRTVGWSFMSEPVRYFRKKGVG